jgi:hypothetical protein
MKAYNIFYALLALVIVSCSKSDSDANTPEEEKSKSIDADYVMLLNEDGMLSSQLLNANAEVITLNPEPSTFIEKTIPNLSSMKGSSFLQYHKNDNCGGALIQHDFSTDASSEIEVFNDLMDCDLTATAITFSDNSIFISYKLANTNPDSYMVRIIDATSADYSFVDVTLDKKPVDLEIANNKLFILTIDELITDENSISVLDLNNNTLIHEIGLGYDAQRIFKDVDDNIIISYEELHTTLNSSSMSVVYTQYETETAPNFVNSTSNQFDISGNLYYPSISGQHSAYDEIPAVYDFRQNLIVLYAFENFLTESKRDFEFEIGTTTAVGYDQENNLILIGYQKAGTSKKGGLLRVKPAPEPAFIDNIDLEGIPYEIIVN